MVVVALALVILWFPGAGWAQSTYPVESFLDWTESPQCDATGQVLTDPSEECGGADVGQYNFEAGMVGVARRAAQRYPEHYDPERLAEPDGDFANLRSELQAAIDAVGHNRPRAPYDHWGDVGHPSYMPDWDHDGVYGDGGGFQLDDRGDFDADSDDVADTAYFRYPRAQPDGSVTYDGRLGLAHEVKIVNSRGLVLDGTLWIPGEALDPSQCPAVSDVPDATADEWDQCRSSAEGSFPAVVFSNGLSSRQEHYYWFSERVAGEGLVVLTYDPAGQGESEGTWTDLFEMTAIRGNCEFAGSCRDLQDAVRWFVGDDVTMVAGGVGGQNDRIADRRNPAYTPAGDNLPNPVGEILSRVDGREVVAIAGNSMGAIATLSYLDYLGDPVIPGGGIDGRPLPPVVAAISLSGAAMTHAFVPVQFQTSDYDGSPLLVGPTVFGVNLGQEGEGIGYKLVKQRYDQLRDETSEDGALSLIVLEGGVHTDHVAVPFVTRTLWANALAADYAADWLNCHTKGLAASCQGAISARPHLSRAFASEEVPADQRGPTASRCIQVPDEASLNQEPDDFVAAIGGDPEYDCTP